MPRSMRTNKDKALNLKLPGALLKRLDRAASQGARTRSAETRARLEHSLKTMPVFTGHDISSI